MADETCTVCGNKIVGFVVPNITEDGEYAPMCVECTELYFDEA